MMKRSTERLLGLLVVGVLGVLPGCVFRDDSPPPVPNPPTGGATPAEDGTPAANTSPAPEVGEAATPEAPAKADAVRDEPRLVPTADNPLIGRWVIDADLVRESDAFRRSPPEMQEALIRAATEAPVKLVFTAETVAMTMGEDVDPERYEIVRRAKNAVKIVSLSDAGERTEVDCLIDGDLLHMRSEAMGEITLRRLREE